MYTVKMPICHNSLLFTGFKDSDSSLKMILFLISCLCIIGTSYRYFQLRHIQLNSKFLKLRSSILNDNPDIVQKHSFVQDELRKRSMKLHTKDQAPNEGEQEAQTPFTKWTPSRANYLQFLVDSLKIHETLEKIPQEYKELAVFCGTGLERSGPLKQDIDWLCKYDTTLSLPDCSLACSTYARFLVEVAKQSIPKFICHYYNYYFAHIAGGTIIGKRMQNILLGGHKLQFYKYDVQPQNGFAIEVNNSDNKIDDFNLNATEHNMTTNNNNLIISEHNDTFTSRSRDVSALFDIVRHNVDKLASTWSENQKLECCDETAACFRYSNNIMSVLAVTKLI